MYNKAMSDQLTTAEIVNAKLDSRERKLFILARRIVLGLDNLEMLAKMGVIGIGDWYLLQELLHDC